MHKLNPSILLTALLLSSCASLEPISGVVPIGPDKYLIGGGVGLPNYANTSLKAKLYQQAAQFCADRTRVMQISDSASMDQKVDESGRVELQFYCLLDSDYRLKR